VPNLDVVAKFKLCFIELLLNISFFVHSMRFTILSLSLHAVIGRSSKQVGI